MGQGMGRVNGTGMASQVVLLIGLSYYFSRACARGRKDVRAGNDRSVQLAQLAGNRCGGGGKHDTDGFHSHHGYSIQHNHANFSPVMLVAEPFRPCVSL